MANKEILRAVQQPGLHLFLKLVTLVLGPLFGFCFGILTASNDDSLWRIETHTQLFLRIN